MIALRSRARALAREPLLHFAVLGAALFALHARVARPPPERIEVSAAFVDALRAEHRERAGREPDADETRRLVDRFVEEELFYREALAQGLDRADLIVRRRLVQKVELLARAQVREPTEDDLAAHLAANPDRYRAADAVSFRHVFVSRDRHGAAAPARAEGLLASLRAGTDPGTLGDPFLLGATFARRTRADLETAFGPTFAEAALAAPPGEWSGPLTSTFGEHLVRVDARAGGQLPALAAVRARVREDLLRERRDAAVRAEVERLRRRYHVEIEGRAP